jgi:hypothetical protein
VATGLGETAPKQKFDLIAVPARSGPLAAHGDHLDMASSITPFMRD